MYHPKVFRVSYERDFHHRREILGGLDSEYSHTTREGDEEYVVAPDMKTAQFLWHHRCRAITDRTDIRWEELGGVTLMMEGVYGL